jgi:hypothetical protein
MDDEQLYYKEKYFKYKLKYVTLKKQLGGDFKGTKEIEKKIKQQQKDAAKIAVQKQKDAADTHNKVREHLAKLLMDIKGKEEYIINSGSFSLSYVYHIDTLINEELKPPDDKTMIKYSFKYSLNNKDHIKKLLENVLHKAKKKKYIDPDKHYDKLYNYLYNGVKDNISNLS